MFELLKAPDTGSSLVESPSLTSDMKQAGYQGISRSEGRDNHLSPSGRKFPRNSGLTSSSATPGVSIPEGVASHRDSIDNSDNVSVLNRIRNNETQDIEKNQNFTSGNIENSFSELRVSPNSSSRPRRSKKPITRFSDEYQRYYTLEVDLNDGENSTVVAYLSTRSGSDEFTFDEILARPDRDLWIKAAIDEVTGLVDKDTWVEEDVRFATSRILPGTWVFKLKRRPDGTIKKYKARYCVRGDLQDGDEETHAPVCDFSTVRIFFVLSLLLGWITCTIDFINVFVQASLTSPVWIHLPRGFRSTRSGNTCLRLKKSLYGLRTAPRLWHEHLRRALLEHLGFKASSFDPCLFFKYDMIAILYVDDLGLAFPSESVLEDFLTELKRLGFEFTREGTFSEFLGIDFAYDKEGKSVTMTQAGLIGKILATAGMTDCKEIKMPTTQLPLGNDDDGERMVEKWNYASVVGMLLYLSTHTRPDISFAVSQIARFTKNPKQSHARAVKYLLRYLKGTADQGITFQLPDEPLHKMTALFLEDYVDADFAGLFRVESPKSDMAARSRTGYIILLCGCPLVWKTQLQSSIALSTQEAEYTALSQSARSVIPIRNILEEALSHLNLHPELAAPQIVSVAFEDNNGALSLATNQRLNNRTKYYHVN